MKIVLLEGVTKGMRGRSRNDSFEESDQSESEELHDMIIRGSGSYIYISIYILVYTPVLAGSEFFFVVRIFNLFFFRYKIFFFDFFFAV